ncbi:TIGR02300 family protein [Sphingomonas koreensis]|nr:TIGR02300 family protein [Sphingomonas koreensis]
MVKPEWGTKRTCPKCATRFYDLGKDDPVTCIECGTAWEPEPILKSKQPLPFETAKPEAKKPDKAADDDDHDDDEDDDLDINEDEEPSPDDEVDLGGDDDLGVKTSDDDEES